VGFQGGEEAANALEETFVDDLLILVGLDFVLAFEALLVDLILLCSDERAFVDIGVDFYVGVVTQFECVLVVVSLVQPGEIGEGGEDEGYDLTEDCLPIYCSQQASCKW